METTKFINKEMALMAATSAFMATVRTGHYANLSGGDETEEFIVNVYLEPEELFTLPSGYVYSGVEERTFTETITECPPFKIKKYYFTF